MKNWKRLLALLLSLVMTLSLFACKSDGEADGTASLYPNATSGDSSENPDITANPDASPAIEADLTQDTTTFAAGIGPDEDLLTVNGDAVKANLLLYWLALSCNNFMSSYGMFGLQLTDTAGDDGSTFADQMRESAVTIAIYNTLLQQKAAELGCLPTDTQAQEARDKMMEQGEDYYKTMTAAYGLSDASMEYLYLSDAYYNNVLDALFPTATDEMLNNYAYQAKHILIKTVDDSNQPLPDDEIAEKRKQAEDILAQLQAAADLEAKFDELMKEYSEDGRDEETGELNAPDGYATARGEMVPEFEEAALALKPGEMSGIVETTYGYHIILRGEMTQEDLQSHAEDCRQYYLDEELGSMLDAAEINRAAALDELDVATFFNRFIAYVNAVFARDMPEDGASGGDDEQGVG